MAHLSPPIPHADCLSCQCGSLDAICTACYCNKACSTRRPPCIVHTDQSFAVVISRLVAARHLPLATWAFLFARDLSIIADSTAPWLYRSLMHQIYALSYTTARADHDDPNSIAAVQSTALLRPRSRFNGSDFTLLSPVKSHISYVNLFDADCDITFAIVSSALLEKLLAARHCAQATLHQLDLLAASESPYALVNDLVRAIVHRLGPDAIGHAWHLVADLRLPGPFMHQDTPVHIGTQLCKIPFTHYPGSIPM